MSEARKSMLSLVVPMHNESGNISALYERVCKVMHDTGRDWELVCVNDGSRDDTLFHLAELACRDPRVVVVDLSRNFGKEAAMTAGIDHARGDAVIPIDADLQDPPEVIPELIAKWDEGFEVVNAVRLERSGESMAKKTTAHLFYRLINRMSTVRIPKDTGDFRLLDRVAVEALKRLPERRRFMKGLFAWVGFKTTEVYYRRDPRASGTTTFNYWKLWNFALEGITSFSSLPLRVFSYLGLLVSVFAFIFASKIVIDTLVFGNEVKGYPSLMVTILFLGGVQLLGLGVLGEYLGRVYEESKQRPVYVVRKSWNHAAD